VIKDRKIDVFAASAILIFGAVLGGFLTYQNMDQRLNDIESEMEGSREVVVVNGTSSNAELTELFQNVDKSVVSVSALGKENAEGSGFVYSSRGHIVTNEHVIDGARKVMVTFTDGRTMEAETVGKDANTDLAVLKVDRRNLEELKLGNLSEVRVGQKAVAIGNPFGLRSTMTAGIISQKGRMLPTETGFSIPNVLQTDAAINPGNSGGPLLNVEGEVVGVNTAIETNTGTFSGVGFAIPVNIVKNVVPKMIQEEGDFQYPWIGVSGFDVTPEIAEAMNLSESSGFLVVEVVNGSPAEEAGVRTGNETVEINDREVQVGGDVIKAINGKEMTGIGDILVYLQRGPEVGQKVNVTVVRDGEEKVIPLTLGSRENADLE
jgi:S1-C subfamily serine protease